MILSLHLSGVGARLVGGGLARGHVTQLKKCYSDIAQNHFHVLS